MLGISPKEALWDYSYETLLMLSAAVPQYGDIEDDWDEAKDANNPNNFRHYDNQEEEIYVR